MGGRWVVGTTIRETIRNSKLGVRRIEGKIAAGL